MPLSVIEIIELRTPQFTTCTRLSKLIELASSLTGSNFGEYFNSAVALRVMHWLTKERIQNGILDIDSGEGIAGGVSNKKEGQLSISFSGGSENTEFHLKFGDLTTTTFGLELIDLIKSVFMTITNRMID
jgi:hypothetical protein